MLQKTAVHSFDVYGVLIDANLVGEQIINLFQEVASGNLPEDEIKRRVTDYQSLLAKKESALKDKPRILSDVYKYAINRGATIDLSKALYGDALQTMVGILDAKEQVATLGSQAFDTNYLPDEIARRMIGSFAGNKSESAAFAKLERLVGDGHRLISHTEDGLIELRAAATFGIPRNNLVYVDRDNSSKENTECVGFSVASTLTPQIYLTMDY
ncbi:hypothetical protein CL619_03790 [archaeon]|nr:hypothetical protein [archaeon]